MLDAHGKIGWGRSDIGGDPIVVVLTESVSDSHLAGLRGEGVSYFFAGKSEIDLALALDILNRELGVKRLLVEGGGGRQRRLPARRTDRRIQPDPLSGGRRRERGATCVRLDGGGQRPARAGHRDDAGEQPDLGRRRDVAALSDPERGRGSRSGSITPDGQTDSDHIVVVGAGAAGLMAARELARAGKRVTILEARDRCGGRIDPLSASEFGYPAEGGAEFVHGEAPVTRALLREAGLSLLPIEGTQWSVDGREALARGRFGDLMRPSFTPR